MKHSLAPMMVLLGALCGHLQAAEVNRPTSSSSLWMTWAGRISAATEAKSPRRIWMRSPRAACSFTQFYNTGRCCPTRASLLTGLYPHQAGVGHMTDDKGLPGYQGRLNDQCVTMAEVLQPAGYFTAMTGKWHVGQNLGVVPWQRGFERSLNAPAGGFYYAE